MKLFTMTSTAGPLEDLSSLFEGDVLVQDLTPQLPEELQGRVLWASLKDELLTVLLPKARGADIFYNQNSSHTLYIILYYYTI